MAGLALAAAFRYRDFRLYWFGHAVSNGGTWMETLGQGWLVVQLAVRDGSPGLAPLYLGLIGLARALPALGLGLVAGAVADRVERRRLLILTQLASVVPALALFVLVAADSATIGLVVAAAAVRSALFSFELPLRQAMVPHLVQPQHLMSAVGLTQAGTTAPQVLGPLLGGLIVQATGSVALLFLFNAASYVCIAGALALMRTAPPSPSVRTSIVASVREGLGYMRHDPVIRWCMILFAAVSFFSRPFVFLIPAFAADVLLVGATGLSWLMAAMGAGGFGGALLVAGLGSVRRRGLLVLSLCAGSGLSVMLFATQRDLAAGMALAACVGLSSVAFNGVANTTLQTTAPRQMLGRVMSVFSMIFIGVLPLGQFVLGALGSVVRIDTALFIGGAGTLAVAAYAALRVPAIRGLESATGRDVATDPVPTIKAS